MTFAACFDVKFSLTDPRIVGQVILQLAIAATMSVDFKFPLLQVQRIAVELIAPHQVPACRFRGRGTVILSAEQSEKSHRTDEQPKGAHEGFDTARGGA